MALICSDAKTVLAECESPFVVLGNNGVYLLKR
jgi:hypothetical protein